MPLTINKYLLTGKRITWQNNCNNHNQHSFLANFNNVNKKSFFFENKWIKKSVMTYPHLVLIHNVSQISHKRIRTGRLRHLRIWRDWNYTVQIIKYDDRRWMKQCFGHSVFNFLPCLLSLAMCKFGTIYVYSVIEKIDDIIKLWCSFFQDKTCAGRL